MSFHSGRSVALASIVVACAFWTAGCGQKKPGDDKSQPAPGNVQPPAPSGVPTSAPEPLPDPLVKAWTQAGATAGWFRQTAPGFVTFLPTLKSLKADDVPAFVFISLPEGVLAKLPPPQQPFGLELGSENADVTDASLKGLAKFERLHTLYLGGSKVTDAGLKELARLKELQRLSFSSRMTDKGLKELAGLKSLQTLTLDQTTQVTDAGVRELQKALPNCKIIK